MAERAGLLNRCTDLNLYRGFESLPLRQVTVSYSLKACKTLILHAFLFLVLSHKVSICINFCYLTGYPLLDFKNG